MRALALKAVRTQEAADEPYVVFSTVGVGATQTRVPRHQRRTAAPAHHICTCTGAPAPAGIGISAQVLENDNPFVIIEDGDPFAARNVLNSAIRSAGPLADPPNANGWVTGDRADHGRRAQSSRLEG